MSAPAYAELHCLSAFSFQRGASVAPELFARAKAQGYAALAITDECSLAGIVRALEASEETGVALIVGAEFRIDAGPKIVLLCENIRGYQHLCWLITVARRRADKGSYRSLREDFPGHCDGLLCLVCEGTSTADADIAWLKSCFPQRLWLAVELHRGADDPRQLQQLQQLAKRHQLPMVASGDVHMHVRGRRALQDLLTAVRHHCTLQEAGWRLFPNGERHLRTRQALAAIYGPEPMAETLRIARRCTFDLRNIEYTYPHELVPPDETATSWLRHLVEEGAKTRWPAGVPPKARAQIEHELDLIAKLDYESYFLTVHDIVRFAREQDILCQGRGSAANSAVCYALGVTELDPGRMNLLFERFISLERNEPPDIDIDFEHERREEVLQYVYRRYGRERAALTAVAISYRGRSAMRDVARAMGLPPDQVDELSRTMGAWSEHAPTEAVLRERGFDPDAPIIRNIIARVAELIGFPRHLSQHPGGFVISEHPLHTLVPVENASMDDRTVVQWDKDDLETLGLMKVDCLALGMLTAVRKTLQMLRDTGRRELTLATIPAEDRATYDMIGKAETVGVFQIESRAQMAMLPRLQPRKFYDLVIQVAIVRPGPIQGDMVHPYLRRRRGEEAVNYPPQLKDVFERTLGVPLFQEQVMQMAVVAAGFTPGEADQLRRSMAAWKRRGGLEPYEQKLTDGMLARGYSREYARELFERIKGFGSYGFPESHAASFAIIAYASAWLRCHEPAAFAAGLINSQPLGFYSNDQILQDVRRRGIRVLPVDVRYSDWDCALEFPRGDSARPPDIRLGLRLIQGFQEDAAERLSRARATQTYADVADLGMRARLDARHLALLADAGALKGLSGHRHRARWNVSGVEKRLPLFDGAPATIEPKPQLPVPSAYDDMRADLTSIHTTLGKHPLSFVRKLLAARRYRRSSELAELPHGRRVRFAGIVTMRQRPQTASGVTFVTLEDEDGMVNAVVWQHVAERQHRIFLESRILGVDGRLERVDGVQHLVVDRMENADDLLAVSNRSRDFR